MSLSTVNDQAAASYGLAAESGAYVAAVSQGSGAEAAGLQEGDIITALDGESVEGASDLMLAVRGKNPGDTVKLTVNRNGQEQDDFRHPGRRRRQPESGCRAEGPAGAADARAGSGL